jgi:acylaminoacyl-peptidase
MHSKGMSVVLFACNAFLVVVVVSIQHDKQKWMCVRVVMMLLLWLLCKWMLLHSCCCRSPSFQLMTPPPSFLIVAVQRSVRDIDQNRRRKFLYTVPILTVSKQQPPQDSSSTSSTVDSPSTVTTTSVRIPPTELPGSVLFPLVGTHRTAVFVSHTSNSNAKNGAGGDAENKQQYHCEIWDEKEQCLQRRIDLSGAGGRHGRVMVESGSVFGVPSWNSDETILVYAAERKPIATASFFDARTTTTTRSDTNPSTDGGGVGVASVVVVGGQHTLGIGKHEGWGEKHGRQQHPLTDLFCVNATTGKVGRVENVPELDGDVALGQAVFRPASSNQNGDDDDRDDHPMIVYTGWDAGGGGEMPRRLGLAYCQQRPSKLYKSSVVELLRSLKEEARIPLRDRKGKDDGEDSVDSAEGSAEIRATDTACVCLTPSYRLACSPRFSPVNAQTGTCKLVFLGSERGFDTHFGCYSLAAMDAIGGTNDFTEPSVLVRQVVDPYRDSPKEAGVVVAGQPFPGLYMLQLPVSCFLSERYLLATTQWGSCQKVIRIDVEDGSVRLVRCRGVHEFSSDAFLCSVAGDAFVSTATPCQPATVLKISANDLLCENLAASLEGRVLTRMAPISATTASSVCVSESTLDLSFDIVVIDAPKVEGVSFENPIESILLLPNKAKFPNPPMIVVPHGGPHSASSTSYTPSYAYLCGHGGYAVLLVNYRGSIGFGQGAIESLPTNIGTLDVEDLIAATNSVLKSGLVDPERVGICGGSHGGYLTAHATSQYPDLFRAAAMRNPVVNIASMVTATDIPDWCYVEATGSYSWKEFKPPTKDEILTMYDRSPVRLIDRVRTPTLVALGLKDLRVPPSQGLEWFHSLRSRGCPAKLLLYENDDHAIDGVAAEADHWINVKHWFDQYLK